MTEKIYKNILWFGMAAIIVFSPIGKGAARIWSITPILLVSYALIFIWLWRINNRDCFVVPPAAGLLAMTGRKGAAIDAMTRIRGAAIDIPIFLFGALAITSTFFSIYKHDSFYELLKLFCYAGLYYLIVNEFDRDMVRRLLYIVIMTGAVLSAYGILQYLNLCDHSWWDPEGFMAATFVNHNHFSGYLELAIPAAVIFVLKKHALAFRLLIVSALMIMVAAFVLAQSRGAWIGLSVSLLAMVFIVLRKRNNSMRSVIFLTLLAAAVISLAYFGKDIISERIGPSAASSGAEDASFTTRLKIWQGSIDMIRHNFIFGTGIGTFAWGFPKYRPEGLNVMANFAHNDYLQIACETGILGLVIALWLFVVVIKTGLSKGNLRSYRLGCSIGVLSLSLHALSDFNFHIPANMLLFTIYLAIIMEER